MFDIVTTINHVLMGQKKSVSLKHKGKIMDHEEADYDKLKAPSGYLWICTACGKTSDHKLSSKANHRMHGWDISCALNSILVKESDIIRDENGYATHIEAENEKPDIR